MKRFTLILSLFSVLLNHYIYEVDSYGYHSYEGEYSVRSLKEKSSKSVNTVVESTKSENSKSLTTKSVNSGTHTKAAEATKATKSKSSKAAKSAKSTKANSCKPEKSKKAGKSGKSGKSRKASKGGKGGKSGKSLCTSETNSTATTHTGELCLTEAVREANITSIVSSISDSITLDSPAEKALNWLQNEDVGTNACDGTLDIIERYILALFYFSTNGHSWKINTNWLDPVDHCEWYGVICTNGPVDGIILDGNNLGGVLPKELSFLTPLNTLRVYQNKIQGEIPHEIYSLSLTFLDLELNQFTGEPFPPGITRAMSSLRRLRISQNPFSQYSLPSYLGNMTRLEQLWVVDTNAIGTIPPEINQLLSLEQLLARDNAFTGPIPAMGRLLNLDRILLQNNRFESTIPSSFGYLSKLRLLKLSNNNLIGSMPSSFPNLVNIEELELANNTLTGKLPDLSPLVSLRIFDLSNNNFIGTIPDFALSPKLNYTNLGFNSFSDSIPAYFFELPELKYLYLNNNDLYGAIPENYGNSKSLIDLYLNNNRLTSNIPEISSGDLPNIKELLINSNTLVGPVPDSLCDGRTWISLHADCHAEEGTDTPRNICPVKCCTTCFPIKPSTSYYSKTIDGSNVVISLQPSSSDINETGFFKKLKAWFMRLLSPKEWSTTEWIIFSIAVFGGVSILVCLFNCFCCRDSKHAKKRERMREKKRIQREKLREKHLEEYCEGIKEKMREKNLEVEREMHIWSQGEKIANKRDLVDVPL